MRSALPPDFLPAAIPALSEEDAMLTGLFILTLTLWIAKPFR